MNWKEVSKKVEALLYNYPIWKESLELEKELEEIGLSQFIPPMTASYEERVGKPYSEWHSSTERFAIAKIVKERNVKIIERAMTRLTDIEKELIVRKYFDPQKPSDTELSLEMGFSRPIFIKTNKEALRKLAVFMDRLVWIY